MPPIATVLIVLAVVALLLIFAIFVKMLKICSPNEVLVISGTKSRIDGKEVGFRVIRGGKSLILPLWEKVDRLDLTNIAIEVMVKGAYTKGGVPVNVSGVANVKVPGQGPHLMNAVERLLGKPRNEIRQIAKDTLEGNLRGVMASLTPEELNEDKIRFAQLLAGEADEDLHRLGLVLDTLKVQNVWDDVRYLDSIGRTRNAEIQKQAIVAEAVAKAASAVRDAQNRRETEVARIEAALDTLRAQTDKEITEAKTRQNVLVATEQGEVSALVAKARGELQVQHARVEQARRKLQADVVEPARARMNQSIAGARGAAAQVIERGNASAEALRQIASMWKLGGANARDAFLFQKLDVLMGLHMHTVGKLHVDRLTILPGGTGGGGGLGGDGAGGSATFAQRLVRLNEEVRAALGVNLADWLKQHTGGPGDGTPGAASA